MSPTRARLQAVALLIAAASNAVIGAWAVWAPRGFFDGFPGSGQHWVSMMGAYDEHLVFDVGLLFLAITVTLLAALIHRGRALVRTASLSALVFAAPHLWYHAGHLGGFSTAAASAELASLSIMVAAPIVALGTTLSR